MQRSIHTIADLKQYLVGLFHGRPGDRYPRIQHAGKVDNVIMQIAGCLVFCADDDTIRVSQRPHAEADGAMRDINMLRFSINERPYFLAYKDKAIEIREGTRWGRPLMRIDNSCSASEIFVLFNVLAKLDGSAKSDTMLMAVAKAVARVSEDEPNAAEILATLDTELKETTS
jgi:hypothetical protein